MKKYCFLALLLASCSSQMNTRYGSSGPSALEEIRVALMDVKQAYQTQKMDIQLLEEKMNKQKPTTETASVSSTLESRIAALEKMQEKIQEDLHQLGTHANQTNQSLLQYRNQIQTLERNVKKQNECLDEVVRLKGTLQSISHSLGSGSSQGKIHRVHSGDSLEKIARQYNTSVESLKRINGLSTNTIIIGQELKIAD